MKKVLIGCGVVMLVAFLLFVGVVVYLGVQLKKFGESVEATKTKFDTLDAKFPWTEPTDGVVPPERLAAFFDARAGIWENFANHPELQQMVGSLSKGAQGGTAAEGAQFGFGAMLSLPGQMREIADRSVAVLESSQMSAKEYMWLNRYIYSVLAERNKNDEAFTAQYDALGKALSAQFSALDPNLPPDDTTMFAQMIRDGLRQAGAIEDPGAAADQLKNFFEEWLETPSVFLDLILLTTKVQQNNQGTVTINSGGIQFQADPPGDGAASEGGGGSRGGYDWDEAA